MYSTPSIPDPSSYHTIWKVFFLASVVLGFYLLLIIIGNRRLRNHQGRVLGLFTAILSLLLLNLTATLYPLRIHLGFLQAAGLTGLYLVGPLSYYIQNNHGRGVPFRRIAFHFLPAVLITVLYLINPSMIAFFYRAGFVYLGVYLLVQTIQFFRINHGPVHLKQKFTFYQVGAFAVICSTLPTKHFYFAASIGLSFLILVIWIGLLRSAYFIYLENIS